MQCELAQLTRYETVVTEIDCMILSLIYPVSNFSSSISSSCCCLQLITYHHLFTLSCPHLFQILVSRIVSYKSITLISSLSNLIIPSQRLVTMSVSLCPQTVLCCLIIQVLNIKSLFPKCLIQSLSLL